MGADDQILAQLAAQAEAEKQKNNAGDPPAGDPPAGDPKPGDDNKQGSSSSKQDDPPAGDPPSGDPPAGDPPAGDPPAPDDVELTDQDYLDLINDKTGLNLKSLDDLKPAQAAYANETIKELNDFVMGGGTLDEYMSLKLTDYKSMDPIELVRRYEMARKPSVKPDVIERGLKRKFATDDLTDDDEVQEREDALTEAAAEALEYFQGKTSSLKAKIEQGRTFEPEQKSDGPSEEDLLKFQNNLNKDLGAMDEIEVGGVKFTLDEKSKSAISEKPWDVYAWFQKENGEFDHRAFNRLRALALNDKAIVEKIKQETRTQVLKELEDDRNNVRLDPDLQRGPDGKISAAGSQKAMANLLKKDLAGGKLSMI